MSRLNITNATKANLLAAINALLGVLVLFGVDLTADQMAGILTAVNALAVLIIGLTYKKSPKRVEE